MYLLINGKQMVEEYRKLEDGHKSPTLFKPVELTRIIKTNTGIKCYKNKELYCVFDGIQNWDMFTIQGGEFEEEITQTDLQQEVNAKLLKDSANLQIELNKQKELNATLLMQIAQLGGR